MQNTAAALQFVTFHTPRLCARAWEMVRRHVCQDAKQWHKRSNFTLGEQKEWWKAETHSDRNSWCSLIILRWASSSAGRQELGGRFSNRVHVRLKFSSGLFSQANRVPVENPSFCSLNSYNDPLVVLHTPQWPRGYDTHAWASPINHHERTIYSICLASDAHGW